jgi:hypothetical protein
MAAPALQMSAATPYGLISSTSGAERARRAVSRWRARGGAGWAADPCNHACPRAPSRGTRCLQPGAHEQMVRAPAATCLLRAGRRCAARRCTGAPSGRGANSPGRCCCARGPSVARSTSDGVQYRPVHHVLGVHVLERSDELCGVEPRHVLLRAGAGSDKRRQRPSVPSWARSAPRTTCECA